MIHRLIGTSTAAESTGLPTQSKLFRVSAGPFAGRLLAVYPRSAAIITRSYSDPPYTNWSNPGDFVTEADDFPLDAVMDADGHVYVAYTQQTTGALRCVKLTYANGVWATQTAVTVYDSGSSTNKNPSLLKDAYDQIRIVWTRDDSGTYTLRSKLSVDDGQTFGTGSADAGTDLSGNTSSCFGSLIARGSYIHCLYTVGGATLHHRSRDLDAALWSSAETLYTGTGLGSDFNAGVSAGGMLGCAFAADGQLYLKEYDGAVWGALQTVRNQPVTSPALRYVGSAPYVIFLETIGTNQNQLFESHREGGSFVAGTGVLAQAVPFATVFCHDADAPTPFSDVTAAAADSAGADVKHPTSGALFAAVSDALYLGGDDRFTLTRVLLSTAGTGGVVAWAYWDGTAWIDFVPDSGAYHFDQANAAVRLFPDGAATPASWRKLQFNGYNRYWIRVLVGTVFTTPPIGSQITAVPDTSDVIPRR